MKKRREKTAKNVKKHALLVKKKRFHMTKKRSRVKKSEEEKKARFSRFPRNHSRISNRIKKQKPVMPPSGFQGPVEAWGQTSDPVDCHLPV